MVIVFRLILPIFLQFCLSPAFSQSIECGSLQNHFGPFDYRSVSHANKFIVENAHFTNNVQSLRRGNSSSIGADLGYTLRTMPNHHRALMTLMNLSFKEKTNKPNGSGYSVECYFDRAITFRPDDGMVRMIYGIYLAKLGKQTEAIKQLNTARESLEDDGNIFYNLGLAYFELKDYDQALSFAHKAYRLGFPLPGLRKKLAEKGKWRDQITEVPIPTDNNNTEQILPENLLVTE